MTGTGVLYVVATPIGNLADISARAREILGSASAVAAEDTRHSGRLLRELGLERPLVSLHEHNERARVPELIARLQAGESIALLNIPSPKRIAMRSSESAGALSGLRVGRTSVMSASLIRCRINPCRTMITSSVMP